MHFSTWVALIVLLLLFFVFPMRRKQAAVCKHIMQKRKKEGAAMEALARQFIGKECLLYTVTEVSGSVQGTIKEVNGSGLLLEDAQGQLQAINLEFVTRIREFPRNKKGKKKSIIVD